MLPVHVTQNATRRALTVHAFLHLLTAQPLIIFLVFLSFSLIFLLVFRFLS